MADNGIRSEHFRTLTIRVFAREDVWIAWRDAGTGDVRARGTWRYTPNARAIIEITEYQPDLSTEGQKYIVKAVRAILDAMSYA